MKKQKTYNYYKKFLKSKFLIGYSHSKVVDLFSIRFNVSKKYSYQITYLFYTKFLNALTVKEWPIKNLNWSK